MTTESMKQQTGESTVSRESEIKYTSVTTTHDRIGYSNNVEIVERALREQFGFCDNSHVLTAVAAHVWAQICGETNCDSKAEWSIVEVRRALDCCEARLRNMRSQLVFRSRQIGGAQ